MVSHFGDYDTTETVVIPFNTFSSDDPSASVTITNLANTDIHIHKDGGLTQRSSASGVTVSIDFDSITGNHLCTIDLSDNTDAGFYANGSTYQVRMEGTTIDGATINAWIGSFSIGRMLRPTTAGRTLDVSSTGEAGIDWANVGSPTTSVNLSGTTISTSQAIGSVSGNVGGIAAGGITAATFAANAIDAAALAADAGTEIGTAVWASTTRTLTAATNITSTGGTIVTSGLGAVDCLVQGFLDQTLSESTPGNIGTNFEVFLDNADAITTAVIDDITAILQDTAAHAAAHTSGISDSGTTTTMVDAARTEADTDYWKGSMIRFNSGTIAGQTRMVTGFDPATDTITFEPATTQAVGINQYEIWPAANPWLAATRTLSAPTNITSDGNAINATSGVIDQVTLVDTTTTNTDMRGTDNAALASVCTEARLSELDAGTSGKAAAEVDRLIQVVLTGLTAQNETDAGRHSLAAVVMISTNASVSGGTLTAKKPSDDTTFDTYTVTTDAAADNITGIS